MTVSDEIDAAFSSAYKKLEVLFDGHHLSRDQYDFLFNLFVRKFPLHYLESVAASGVELNKPDTNSMGLLWSSCNDLDLRKAEKLIKLGVNVNEISMHSNGDLDAGETPLDSLSWMIRTLDSTAERVAAEAMHEFVESQGGLTISELLMGNESE